MSNEKRPSKHYTPDEMSAAVNALMNNRYHNFQVKDAEGILIALQYLGFRLVKTE